MLKIGDDVKIVKHFDIDGAVWMGGMDDTIGHIGKVEKYDEGDGTYLVNVQDVTWWYFPESLEKVETVNSTVEPSMDYDNIAKMLLDGDENLINAIAKECIVRAFNYWKTDNKIVLLDDVDDLMVTVRDNVTKAANPMINVKTTYELII